MHQGEARSIYKLRDRRVGFHYCGLIASTKTAFHSTSPHCHEDAARSDCLGRFRHAAGKEDGEKLAIKDAHAN